MTSSETEHVISHSNYIHKVTKQQQQKKLIPFVSLIKTSCLLLPNNFRSVQLQSIRLLRYVPLPNVADIIFQINFIIKEFHLLILHKYTNITQSYFDGFSIYPYENIRKLCPDQRTTTQELDSVVFNIVALQHHRRFC